MAKKRHWTRMQCRKLNVPKLLQRSHIAALRGHAINLAIYQSAARPATMAVPKRLTRSFFNRSVLEVAPDLIGATLMVDGVGGRIVEVEAYHHTEPAAHSYHGPTERNAVMFGPPGYATSTAPMASTGA